MLAVEAIVAIHPTDSRNVIITNRIAAAEWWSLDGLDDDFVLAMRQQRVLDENTAQRDAFPVAPDAGRLRRSARPLFQDDGPPSFAEWNEVPMTLRSAIAQMNQQYSHTLTATASAPRNGYWATAYIFQELLLKSTIPPIGTGIPEGSAFWHRLRLQEACETSFHQAKNSAALRRAVLHHDLNLDPSRPALESTTGGPAVESALPCVDGTDPLAILAEMSSAIGSSTMAPPSSAARIACAARPGTISTNINNRPHSPSALKVSVDFLISAVSSIVSRQAQHTLRFRTFLLTTAVPRRSLTCPLRSKMFPCRKTIPLRPKADGRRATTAERRATGRERRDSAS